MPLWNELLVAGIGSLKGTLENPGGGVENLLWKECSGGRKGAAGACLICCCCCWRNCCCLTSCCCCSVFINSSSAFCVSANGSNPKSSSISEITGKNKPMVSFKIPLISHHFEMHNCIVIACLIIRPLRSKKSSYILQINFLVHRLRLNNLDLYIRVAFWLQTNL